MQTEFSFGLETVAERSDHTYRSAVFSPCQVYRYQLCRVWDPATYCCNFIMLNPSTADEVRNDPTVERCERRARAWNYGGLLVTNIFAFRSTDPKLMKAAADPVGPNNDHAIIETAKESGIVICAWGQHGKHNGRSADVVRLLMRSGLGHKLHVLRMSASGEPWHPLYLPYDLQPSPAEFGPDV